MTYEVRTILASEFSAWLEVVALGLHQDLPDGSAEYFAQECDFGRTWGAIEAGRVTGSLRSFPTPLTVPGRTEVTAAALTNVAVAPNRRRRGILTEMITADLRASVERDESVGILIAAEYPIYGRFGYGPAVRGAEYRIDTVGLTWHQPSEGSIEVSDRKELRDVGPGVYDRFRAAQPGSIERSDHWWDQHLHQVDVPGAKPPTSRVVLYRSRLGELEGYAIYEAREKWDGMRPEGTLDLRELVSLSSAAYQGLWEYCCSVDLLRTVVAGNRSVDEVLPLLVADGRAVKQTSEYDFVWVRILDADRALAARRYGADGRLVIEVVDDLGLTAGRFALDGGPDGASCQPTTESIDLTLPVATLGALYLGGESASRLAAAGRLDEQRPGALAVADRMFKTGREPWCTTWF